MTQQAFAEIGCVAIRVLASGRTVVALRLLDKRNGLRRDVELEEGESFLLMMNLIDEDRLPQMVTDSEQQMRDAIERARRQT